jgi:hypothetical protein
MNPFIHILHLGVKVKEFDQGVCIVWRCLRFEVPRDYRLIQSRGNISFIGLEFSRPAVMLDLRCSVCGYEIRVDRSEKSMLAQSAEETRLLKAGCLSAEAYQKKVRSLPARFVKAQKALNECWKCSSSGEDIPVTFDSCWNCRKKNGVQSVDQVAGGRRGAPNSIRMSVLTDSARPDVFRDGHIITTLRGGRARFGFLWREIASGACELNRLAVKS